MRLFKVLISLMIILGVTFAGFSLSANNSSTDTDSEFDYDKSVWVNTTANWVNNNNRTQAKVRLEVESDKLYRKTTRTIANPETGLDLVIAIDSSSNSDINVNGAKALADEYLSPSGAFYNNGRNRIAIVVFNLFGYALKPSTDVSSKTVYSISYDKNGRGYTASYNPLGSSEGEQYFSKDVNLVKNALDNLSVISGSNSFAVVNYDAGLYTADSIIANRSNKARTSAVVFFTAGAPFPIVNTYGLNFEGSPFKNATNKEYKVLAQTIRENDKSSNGKESEIYVVYTGSSIPSVYVGNSNYYSGRDKFWKNITNDVSNIIKPSGQVNGYTTGFKTIIDTIGTNLSEKNANFVQEYDEEVSKEIKATLKNTINTNMFTFKVDQMPNNFSTNINSESVSYSNGMFTWTIDGINFGEKKNNEWPYLEFTIDLNSEYYNLTDTFINVNKVDKVINANEQSANGDNYCILTSNENLFETKKYGTFWLPMYIGEYSLEVEPVIYAYQDSRTVEIRKTAKWEDDDKTKARVRIEVESHLDGEQTAMFKRGKIVGVDFVLVIDRSASGLGKNRSLALEALDVITGNQDDDDFWSKNRVAIIDFSQTANLNGIEKYQRDGTRISIDNGSADSYFKTSKNDVKRIINNVKIGTYEQGGAYTNFDGPMFIAKELITKRSTDTIGRTSAIIYLSDGCPDPLTGFKIGNRNVNNTMDGGDNIREYSNKSFIADADYIRNNNGQIYIIYTGDDVKPYGSQSAERKLRDAIWTKITGSGSFDPDTLICSDIGTHIRIITGTNTFIENQVVIPDYYSNLASGSGFSGTSRGENIMPIGIGSNVVYLSDNGGSSTSGTGSTSGGSSSIDSVISGIQQGINEVTGVASNLVSTIISQTNNQIQQESISQQTSIASSTVSSGTQSITGNMNVPSSGKDYTDGKLPPSGRTGDDGAGGSVSADDFAQEFYNVCTSINYSIVYGDIYTQIEPDYAVLNATLNDVINFDLFKRNAQLENIQSNINVGSNNFEVVFDEQTHSYVWPIGKSGVSFGEKINGEWPYLEFTIELKDEHKNYKGWLNTNYIKDIEHDGIKREREPGDLGCQLFVYEEGDKIISIIHRSPWLERGKLSPGDIVERYVCVGTSLNYIPDFTKGNIVHNNLDYGTYTYNRTDFEKQISPNEFDFSAYDYLGFDTESGTRISSNPVYTKDRTYQSGDSAIVDVTEYVHDFVITFVYAPKVNKSFKAGIKVIHLDEGNNNSEINMNNGTTSKFDTIYDLIAHAIDKRASLSSSLNFSPIAGNGVTKLQALQEYNEIISNSNKTNLEKLKELLGLLKKYELWTEDLIKGFKSIADTAFDNNATYKGYRFANKMGVKLKNSNEPSITYKALTNGVYFPDLVSIIDNLGSNMSISDEDEVVIVMYYNKNITPSVTPTVSVSSTPIQVNKTAKWANDEKTEAEVTIEIISSGDSVFTYTKEPFFIFAIDRSISTNDTAINTASNLLKSKDARINIAVVQFAGNAQTYDFSSDLMTISNNISAPFTGDNKNTNFEKAYSAIEELIKPLDLNKSYPIIVWFTDGAPTPGFQKGEEININEVANYTNNADFRNINPNDATADKTPLYEWVNQYNECVQNYKAFKQAQDAVKQYNPIEYVVFTDNKGGDLYVDVNGTPYTTFEQFVSIDDARNLIWNDLSNQKLLDINKGDSLNSLGNKLVEVYTKNIATMNVKVTDKIENALFKTDSAVANYIASSIKTNIGTASYDASNGTITWNINGIEYGQQVGNKWPTLQFKIQLKDDTIKGWVNTNDISIITSMTTEDVRKEQEEKSEKDEPIEGDQGCKTEFPSGEKITESPWLQRDEITPTPTVTPTVTVSTTPTPSPSPTPTTTPTPTPTPTPVPSVGVTPPTSQLIPTPGSDSKVLVLDKEFTLDWEIGNFESLVTGDKLVVKYPFDVFYESKFISANNEIVIKEFSNTPTVKPEGKATFRLPSWVVEKDYEDDNKGELTKLWVHPADNSSGYVTCEIKFKVVGALYDFSILNINGDNDWKNSLITVPQKTSQFLQYKADTLPIGQNNVKLVEGATTIRTSNLNAGDKISTQSSAYPYGLKLGTSFLFSINTKGLISDKIKITPRLKYYALDGNGKYVQKNSGIKYVYRIQGVQGDVLFANNDGIIEVDKGDFITILKNYTGSSKEFDNDLEKAIKYMQGDDYGTSEFRSIANAYKVFEANKQSNYGKYKELKLPNTLRLPYSNYASTNIKLSEVQYIGAKNNLLKYVTNTYMDYINNVETNVSDMMVDNTDERIVNSLGHWYAEYKLPASLQVKEDKGTNLKLDDEEKALKGGFVIVEFEISSLDSSENPYLLYDREQWNTERNSTGRTVTIELPVSPENKNLTSRQITIEYKDGENYYPVAIYDMNTTTSVADTTALFK